MTRNSSLAPELPETEPGSGIRQTIPPAAPDQDITNAFEAAENIFANHTESDKVEPDRITEDMNTMVAYIIAVDSKNEQ